MTSSFLRLAGQLMAAIIFVPALVGCIVFGFVFALFAAHYYLTVLQNTGSGSNEVAYVSEPILDNFWKVFYLGWLFGVWLVPAWLLSRAYAGGTAPLWVKFAVPLAVFWICYPVSQLSSLSGPSIWLPLHPDVFGRLAAKPGVVVGFLLLSGATLAVMGAAFHWTFTADGMTTLIVGCPLLVASALLYARLIGRLAFALAFTRSILSRRKKKRPATEQAASAEQSDESQSESVAESRFMQPSDLPPIQTPDEGPLIGYDVKFEDEQPRTRKRVVAHLVETEAAETTDRTYAKGARAAPAAEDDD